MSTTLQLDGFAGRTVFVTGADGFIGSHLTEALLAQGSDVHAFVRASSSGQLYNIGHLADRLVIHRGDFTDRHSVITALDSLTGKPGAILFHVGAQAHVGESWQRPYETMASNVDGTLNVFQSIVDLKLDLSKVVVSGSSEEYGNVIPGMRNSYRFRDGKLLLDERSPINPKSVYAVSKLATDFLARSYGDAFDIPVVVSRMFNNYGPRQNPRYVTGTIISQALLRDSIELGYLDAKRDFCFCEDGVRGHMALALHGEPGEVYVYGQGRNATIGEWCKLILAIGEREGCWKSGKQVVTASHRGRLGRTEVEELLVDYSKIENLSGWRPSVTWDEGLKRTILWYAENVDKWRSRVDWS